MSRIKSVNSGLAWRTSDRYHRPLFRGQHALPLCFLASLEREVLMDPKSIMPTYKRLDVEFTHGEGVWLYDTGGRRYRRATRLRRA